MYVTASGLLNVLPPMKGIDEVLFQEQDTQDIVRGVLQLHQEVTADYDRIAKYFYDEDTVKMCRELFEFCQREIPYKVETEESQTLRTPAASLAVGSLRGGDCKHYAGFIAGVLDAVNRLYGANIKWCYRFASYTVADSQPGHVFVVVDPGTSNEIWVDPVLDLFNSHYPAPVYYTDKKVHMSLSKISGVLEIDNAPYANFQYVNEHVVGATNPNQLEDSAASKIGTGLLAVAAPLATIPVVGWIAGAAAGVVGGLLKVFGGKKEPESESVRDLIKHYRISVKGADGGPKSNSQKVTVAEADEGQAWFSVVTGVPIYDSWRMMALIKEPMSAAIAAYREFPDTSQISDEVIAQASTIAKSMNYPTIVKGSLKNMVAARVINDQPVDLSTLQGAGYTNPATNNTSMAETNTGVVPNAGGMTATGLKGNPLTMALLLGGGAFLVYEMTKKKSRTVAGIGKVDNTQLLLLGGLGVAGVFLLMRSRQQPVVQQPVYQQTNPYGQQPYAQPQDNLWSFLGGAVNAAGSYFGSR